MTIDLQNGPAILQAIREIESTYGDKVSVSQKAKSLLKFGDNQSVGSTPATLMTLPTSILHETYVSTNAITHISSADAGDTEPMKVEGHIADGSGNLTFNVQDVTLAGTAKTPLPTPLARVTRAYNNGATDLTGPIYIAEDVTFTAGVPQTNTAIHLIIPAGNNQSRKCATSLSSIDYWIITAVYADVLEKAGAFATVELQIREQGKVFRSRVTLAASNTSRGFQQFNPPIIAPKNSDVRLVASANTNNIHVSGGINGYLATIVS